MTTRQKHKSGLYSPRVQVASLLVTGLLLGAAASARAQDINMMFSPGLTPQTMQIMSQIRQNHAWAESAYGRSARYARPRATPAPASAARGADSSEPVTGGADASTPAVLTFPSDPAVSRQVRNAIIAQWKQSNPGKEAAIDAVFAGHDFLSAFRDLAAPYGIDSHDLADVVAAYLVVSWALLHDVAVIDAPPVMAARDQIRQALASSPGVRALDASHRQAMGETLIYETVLLQANRTELARSGDAALRQKIAGQLGRDLRGTGFDLARLDLTARGFVATQ